MTGTLQCEFALYPQETGGEKSWSATKTVDVEGGIFDVPLSDFPEPADLPDDLFLEMICDGEQLIPRLQFSAVPYALRAKWAQEAELAHSIDPTLIGPGLSAVSGGLQLNTATSNNWTGTTTFTGNIVANSVTISPTELGFVDGLDAAVIDRNDTDVVLEAHLKAVDFPTDEECLTYEATVGDFEWQACNSGILADSLDFSDFKDVMALDADAATEINLGASNLTIDLDGTGDFVIADGGTATHIFQDDGLVGIGTTSPSTLLEVRAVGETGGALCGGSCPALNLFTITRESSAGDFPGGAAGIGANVLFKIEDAGGTEEQARITASLTTLTDNAEMADLSFLAQKSGTVREFMSLEGAGGDASTAVVAFGPSAGNSLAGGIKLYDGDAASPENVLIKPPNIADAASFTLTLPSDDGAAGQVLTSTDGTGLLGWTTPSTDAPVGASYLTLGLDGTLTSERTLSAGNGLTSADGGVNSSLTLNVGDGLGITVGSDVIATASGEEAFLASGALTCGAATAGSMKVHTTPLQYCDNAATPALQYAAYGNASGESTAAANDSVALTTDTTGNYVAGLTAGSGITVTGAAGEGWSPIAAVTTNGLDFTHFADTLALDAGPTTLNQGANAWVQNFTGAAATGVTYNFNSVTTASAMVVNANGLTNGGALRVQSTSTAGAAVDQSEMFSVYREAANANASHTSVGIHSEVLSTGATSTNVAGHFRAFNATNNYAGLFEGRVGIGDTTPDGTLGVTTTAAGESSLVIARATSAPTADIATISNSGLATTTTGVDGLAITFAAAGAATTTSGLKIDTAYTGTGASFARGALVTLTDTSGDSAARTEGVRVEIGDGTTNTDSILTLAHNDPAGTVTNGLLIDSGSTGTITTGINVAATAVTTDLSLQNGETIDNNTDGTVKVTGHLQVSGTNARFLGAKGTDVASASNLVLGTGGNYFVITGFTTINCIDRTNWTSGSVIYLRLGDTVAVTVSDNSACTDPNKSLQLVGAFGVAANGVGTLTLVYDNDAGNWYEIARALVN